MAVVGITALVRQVELDEDLFVHPRLGGDIRLFVIPIKLCIVFAFTGIPRSGAIEGKEGVEDDLRVVLETSNIKGHFCPNLMLGG